MEVFNGISLKRLYDILDRIRKARVALIGDISLDVYWRADMTKSELSRETPHFPMPVVEEWMSPGAGGNAAANIAALRPKSIKVLGVAGRDWRGDSLICKLRESGIDTDGIVISERAVTNAYCKPLRKGISNVEYEDPRIDFSNYENLPQQDEDELVQQLEECVKKIDILCVSDQLTFGCITPVIREKIISYAKQGLKVVIDSRDRIALYSGVILKPNEVEGLRAVQKDYGNAKADFEQYVRVTQTLAVQNKSKVCMTLGSKGSLYTDSQMSVYIPSREVVPPIDICGAGDTFLSAFACALVAGAEPREAASFANIAADVTIKKIGITGTASPDEIIDRHMQIFQNA
jgi:rfaE bifunctional protein kinase chain/domain